MCLVQRTQDLRARERHIAGQDERIAAVLFQLRREARLVVIVGKEVLDALEARLRCRGKAVHEVELVPEHRQVGAETGHGS